MDGIYKNRVLELDALRGIAVIFVVLFHFTMLREEAKYGFKLGVTGVDLFFIISGFVIFLTLKNTKHWIDFVVSRFSRLYPTYWTCVTLTTIIIIIFNIYNNTSLAGLYLKYLGNMTMFQFYFKIEDMDGPYWTMIVEMLFYLYMLIIFIAKKLNHIKLIGVVTILPILLYRIPYLKENFGYLFKIFSANIPLINHFPIFFAGIIFYKIKYEKSSILNYGILFLCFLTQISLFYEGGKSREFISFHEYIIMLTVYFFLFILFTTNHLKFIVNKITLFLGSISYALYLSHEYIGLNLITKFTMHFNLSFWTSCMIAMACTITIAYLITRYIEKPAMHSIRKLFKTRNARIIEVPSVQS